MAKSVVCGGFQIFVGNGTASRRIRASSAFAAASALATSVLAWASGRRSVVFVGELGADGQPHGCTMGPACPASLIAKSTTFCQGAWQPCATN